MISDTEKQIRNLLFKVSFDSVFHAIRETLPNLTKEDWMQGHTPWLYLCLLRLAFRHRYKCLNDDFYKLRQNDISAITTYQFNQLLYLTEKIKTEVDKNYTNTIDCSKNYGKTRLVQKIAHEQFPWQKKFHYTNLLRAHFLFNNPNIDGYFTTKFGISYSEFLHCSSLILAYLPQLQRLNLQDIRHQFNLPIEQYLKIVSTKIDLQTEVEEHLLRTEHNESYYFYIESSPFFKFPFIYYKDSYYLLHTHCLEKSIELLPYTTLKKNHSDRFIEVFAKTFEEYIKFFLELHNINYLNESALKRDYSWTGKCVDFVVETEDLLLLFEAKASILTEKTLHNSTLEKYKATLDSSIIKALKQIQVMGQCISATNKNKTIYGFIVTYGDFYTGPISHLHQSINLESSLSVALENIHCINIATFEKVIQILYHDEKTLSDKLFETSEKNKSTLKDAVFDLEIVLPPEAIDSTVVKDYVEKNILISIEQFLTE